MAQHDYVIANGTGAAVRSDLNNALAAIVSQNSGATAPSTTYAYQWWADTATGLLKLRNAANNGWITLFQLDGEWSTIALENGSAAAPSIYFKDSGTDTGIYSPGTDQVAISTGGTGRLFVDSSGRVGLGTSSPGAKLQVSQNTDAGTAISVVSASASTGLTADYATLFLQNTNTTNNNYNAIGFVNDQGGYSSAIYGIYTSHTSGAQSGALAFSTRNAGTFDERMRITAAGNVGIGVTPSAQLDVKATSGTLFRAEYTGVAQLNIGNGGNSINYYDGDTQIFRNGGGTERARIDSSGRLLVGTSTSESITGDQYKIQIKGTDASAGQSIHRSQTNNAPAYLALAKSRSGAIVSSGDGLGAINFIGHDGVDLDSIAATIEAQVDGTPGTNDMPGRLVFSTTADGASSPTERMRIKSNGDTGTFGTSDALFVATSTGAGTGSNLIIGKYSASGTFSGTTSFVVRTNGDVLNTNNSYGAISDIKLKENIVDANSQWDDLKALQVRNYNFKEGQAHRQIGLVAQEVELVSPGLVSESPDRDEEGNDLGTVTKSVNYSVLYMKAVKALQEAMERIETLEAKVTALEAA